MILVIRLQSNDDKQIKLATEADTTPIPSPPHPPPPPAFASTPPHPSQPFPTPPHVQPQIVQITCFLLIITL